MRAQIAAFCVSAVGSGTMFWRWWRMEEEDRPRVWQLYGWFTAFSCLGCTFGAVAYGARVGNLAGLYMASNTSQTQDLSLAQPVRRNEVLRDMLQSMHGASTYTVTTSDEKFGSDAHLQALPALRASSCC